MIIEQPVPNVDALWSRVCVRTATVVEVVEVVDVEVVTWPARGTLMVTILAAGAEITPCDVTTKTL